MTNYSYKWQKRCLVAFSYASGGKGALGLFHMQVAENVPWAFLGDTQGCTTYHVRICKWDQKLHLPIRPPIPHHATNPHTPLPYLTYIPTTLPYYITYVNKHPHSLLVIIWCPPSLLIATPHPHSSLFIIWCPPSLLTLTPHPHSSSPLLILTHHSSSYGVHPTPHPYSSSPLLTLTPHPHSSPSLITPTPHPHSSPPLLNLTHHPHSSPTLIT